MNGIGRISSLDEATAFFRQTMAENPERDMLPVHRAVVAGRRRRYSGLLIRALEHPDDHDPPAGGAFRWPTIAIDDPDERVLATEILGMLSPLSLLNPVLPMFRLGAGSGTLAVSFGIKLDPAAGNAPNSTQTLGQLLDVDPPDPEQSGLIPQIRRRIDLIRRHVDAEIKIGMPPMQGPFNLAHILLGDEAFTGPYEQPERFHRLMDRITDFWIALRTRLREWIGSERSYPWFVQRTHLCQCSTNMISPELYRQFVLPYDLRIAEHFGEISIHPCSGPHVVRMTLEGLPTIRYTEAGFVSKATAGCTPVDDALAWIGDRPVALGIHQEVPEGREYELIRSDLDRYAQHPRLVFRYCGMHWRHRDHERIRDLHRRLDRYWDERYASREEVA